MKKNIAPVELEKIFMLEFIFESEITYKRKIVVQKKTNYFYLTEYKAGIKVFPG